MRSKGLSVRLVMGFLAASGTAAWASEPGCFRTPAEAAAQAGTRDVAGFRLESVERDPFAEVRWARVRSCANPSHPAQLLMLAPGTEVSAAMRHGTLRTSAFRTEPQMVMLAGHQVTLVIHDDSARVEVAATALASAALGERVRVRLVQVSAGGGERIAEGLVRGASLVEMTR